MNSIAVKKELMAYSDQVSNILNAFTKSTDGYYIANGDEARLRQIVLEVCDFVKDELSEGAKYASQISNDYNSCISNWLNSPSLAGVKRIKVALDSIITRIERNPSIVLNQYSDHEDATEIQLKSINKIADCIDILPKSRDYLRKFINSKHMEYFQYYQEYKPQSYGYFEGYEHFVQIIGDISSWLQDIFGNVNIPEKFQTPQQLIDTVENSISILKSKDQYFKLHDEWRATKDLPINGIVQAADTMRGETIDAFTYFLGLAHAEFSPGNISSGKMDWLKLVEIILSQYGNAIKSISRNRRKGKSPFLLEDEYDVQDSLRLILLSIFPDLVVEGHNPQYAGKNSRVEFFIVSKGIMIEVKMIKANENEQKYIKEINEDLELYHSNKDLTDLFIFIYDPFNSIANENNLKLIAGPRKKHDNEFLVHVIIQR